MVKGAMARLLVVAVLTSLAMVLLSGCQQQQAAPKYPQNPIEYVVQASAGGSSDGFVRNLVKLIEDQKLISVPISVVNKEGGGGAVAFNYMKTKEGNPHFLLNTSGNFIAASLRDPTVPGYKDFTPIARIAFDLNSVMVKADSPYKTMADLVSAAKAKPGAISWGGTSVGSQDHLTIVALQKATGAKFNFVSFNASNEVMASLLGGHLDVAAAEPWVAKAQADAGKTRILGVVAEKRLDKLPDLPTLKEQGFDVFLPMQRGVVTSGKVDAAARDYLVDAFKKLTSSSQWKEYATKESIVEAPMFGDDYAKFLADETTKWGDLLKEAGIVK